MELHYVSTRYEDDYDALVRRLRINEDFEDEFREVYEDCLKIGCPKGVFTQCDVSRQGDVTVVGGTFWTHHLAIDVLPEYTGYLAVSGCELKSNGDRTLRVQGGKAVTVSGCTFFHDFETDAPAVSISGGLAVSVTGCAIYSRADAFELTHRGPGAITITGNAVCTGGREIVDRSKNCTVKIDNTLLEYDGFGD